MANPNDYLQFYKKQGFAAKPGANKGNKKSRAGEETGAFGDEHDLYDDDDEDFRKLNAEYGNFRTDRHFELKSLIIKNV